MDDFAKTKGTINPKEALLTVKKNIISWALGSSISPINN
jgi:hypothetical protein